MPQITISMSGELEAEVRNFAARKGYGTISDLVRDALRDKLSVGGGMDFWQRALMVRMLEIHDAVKANPGGDNRMARVELSNGYKAEYGNHFMDVDRDEIGKDVTEFVHQVFACFDRLQRSAKEIGDDGLTQRVRFDGYDGNTEFNYLGYADYLYEDDKYRYIDGSGLHINSHFPMVGAYARMLTKWKEISPESHGKLLTREQIEAVLTAQADGSVRGTYYN